MNEEKAQELKQIAHRTIKIVDLLMAGKSSHEISVATKADRQLVDYYKKILSATSSTKLIRY